MAKSRYENITILKQTENNDINSMSLRMSTFPPLKSTDVISPNDTFYQYRSTDRLDGLAYKHYGDGRYWWIICVANDITSPFDKNLVPGKVLRIPVNIDKIFNVIKNRSGKAK